MSVLLSLSKCSEIISQLSQRHGVYSEQTHQILADKHPNKNGEEDAADEPEDSEGIKLLWVRPSVLGRFLIGQLTPQFHGIVKAGQVLLEASTWGAAEVVWCPLSPRSLPDPPDVVIQRASVWLTAAWQGWAPPLWGGAVGAAPEPRSFWQEGRRSRGRWGWRPGLCPVEIEVEPGFCGTPGPSSWGWKTTLETSALPSAETISV